MKARLLCLTLGFPLLATPVFAETCAKARIVTGVDCASLLVQFDLSGCDDGNKKIATIDCSGDAATATVRTDKATYVSKLAKKGDGWALQGDVETVAGEKKASKKDKGETKSAKSEKSEKSKTVTLTAPGLPAKATAQVKRSAPVEVKTEFEKRKSADNTPSASGSAVISASGSAGIPASGSAAGPAASTPASDSAAVPATPVVPAPLSAPSASTGASTVPSLVVHITTPAADTRAPAAAPSTTLDSAESNVVVKPDASGNFFERNFATSATVLLTSNYVFRGVSQTRSRAAIQGSYDIAHKSGLAVGGFVSNVDLDAPPEELTKTEADVYGLYNLSLGDWTLGAMVIWYSYLDSAHFNTVEYSALVKYGFLKLDVGYMEKYFGLESNSTYGRLTASLPFTAKDTLNLAVGHTLFDKKEQVGQKDYTDYKVSLSHALPDFAFELAYSDTDRKNLEEVPFRDRALTVTASRTF